MSIRSPLPSAAILCASISEAIKLIRERDKLKAKSVATYEPGKSIIKKNAALYSEK